MAMMVRVGGGGMAVVLLDQNTLHVLIEADEQEDGTQETTRVEADRDPKSSKFSKHTTNIACHYDNSES